MPQILPDVGNKVYEQKDPVEYYWAVFQMLDFENIGFLRPADLGTESGQRKIRYLICAGCDIGPIGYEAIGGKQFLIAANRVGYDV